MFQTKKFLLPMLTLALAGASLAQPLEGAKFYKLDFVVKEVEGGKAVNSRNYSTMLPVQMPGTNTQSASIRAGGRVPVSTGNSSQFYEVGVNLDVKELHETAADVAVYITADINTIAQESAGTPPLTRQNRWSGPVIVQPKKPTVVFSSDDVSSKRQLQLELTATPIK